MTFKGQRKKKTAEGDEAAAAATAAAEAIAVVTQQPCADVSKEEEFQSKLQGQQAENAARLRLA